MKYRENEEANFQRKLAKDAEARIAELEAENKTLQYRLRNIGDYVKSLYIGEIKGLNKRIDDLLEANNRYLQRARDAEAELKELRLMMEDLKI